MKETEQDIKSQLKKKFGRKHKLESKVEIHYKDNLEREYQRTVNAYLKLLKDTLTKYLPDIKTTLLEANSDSQEGIRKDANNLPSSIRKIFKQMNVELSDKTERFLLRSQLERLANLTRKLTIREWKRVVSKTLGIDLTDDKYLGEYYKEATKEWTKTNVDLIKSIPKDSLGNMQDIVLGGVQSGKTVKSIMQDIQHIYGVSRNKARFLARDQMSKLNADIAQFQQTDAGVEEYIWSSSGDGRVRDRHKELDGKKFKWSDPPIVDVRTGRRAHPGQDYQCRCVALPVFDIDTLDLPMSGQEKQKRRKTNVKD